MQMDNRNSNDRSLARTVEAISEGGRRYMSPPVHGGAHDDETRVNSLVTLSKVTGMPVGWLAPGGNAYYVVTPSTTPDMVTKQLKRLDGSEGFEKELKAGEKDLETYKKKQKEYDLYAPFVKRTESRTTSDGLHYREPQTVQIGDEAWISALKVVAERDDCVFGKMFPNGSYFVITPKTTAESIQAQLELRDGVQAFETAIELAYRERFQDLADVSASRIVNTGRVMEIAPVKSAVGSTERAEASREIENRMVQSFIEKAIDYLKKQNVQTATKPEDMRSDFEHIRVEITSTLGVEAKKLMGVLYVELDLPADSHPSRDQLDKIRSLYQSVENVFEEEKKGNNHLKIHWIRTDRMSEIYAHNRRLRESRR